MKTTRVIVLAALCIAAIFTVYRYYNLTATRSAEVQSVPAENEAVEEAASSSSGEEDEAVSPVDNEPVDGSYQIEIKTLPEAQQGVLKSLGYTDTITFTPTMIQCATEKLGLERVGALRTGSAPTPLEIARLTPCLSR
jgi:hypothetical protein